MQAPIKIWMFSLLESSVVLTPYFETRSAGTELRHLPIEATFRTIRQVGLERTSDV